MTLLLAEGTEEYREVEWLLQQLDDKRFGWESAKLALAAYPHYDPKVHKLIPRKGEGRGDTGEITYRDFFVEHCFPEYMACKNVRTAIQALDILIARGKVV